MEALEQKGDVAAADNYLLCLRKSFLKNNNNKKKLAVATELCNAQHNHYLFVKVKTPC